MINDLKGVKKVKSGAHYMVGMVEILKEVAVLEVIS